MAFLRWPTNKRDALEYTTQVFREVAPRYALMKAILSFGQERRWKRKAMSRFVQQRSGRCLDLATGNGEISIMMGDVAPGITCFGLDLSQHMLSEAFNVIPGFQARCVLADLSAVPFKDRTFDLVTMGYGLRYTSDHQRFLNRIHDLLAENGQFFLFDLGAPRNPVVRAAWLTYLFVVGSTLGLMLHGRPQTYWHLVESLRAFPGHAEIERMLRESGFERVETQRIMGGFVVAQFASKGS